MTTLRLSIERCKSCGYCILFCPKEALKLSGNLNKEGYDYVAVNDDKCIQCGICYTVCPDNVFEINE
jgi:2-oxoglutarate ferredoxin oxidoreductase subunit delta